MSYFMGREFEMDRRPIPNEQEAIVSGVNEYHAEHDIPDAMDRKHIRIKDEALAAQVKRAEDFKHMEWEIATRKKYRDALRFEMDPKIMRKLAQTPDERRVCTEVYKEVVAERLRGIGAIRVYLLDALAQNPDLETEFLKEPVLSIAEQHGIPRDAIFETLLSFLERYRLRRDAISRKSDSEIITDATGLKIAVEQIYRDTFSIFIVGPKITDIGSISRRGGGSYWPFYEDGIYSHTSASLDDVYVEGTRTHEGQHAIYQLEHNKEPRILKDTSLGSALCSARDEMLAYLRDSKGTFLGTSFFLPSYKSFSGEHNSYQYMHENLSEKDKEEYTLLLKKGEIAARRLLKRLAVEEVIGILSQTPLERWSATADRIVDAEDSAEKYDRLKDKIRQFSSIVRKLGS